jgi:hypothetical protein
MPETNNMRYCTRIRVEDAEDFALPRWEERAYESEDWADWTCTSSSSQLPWPTMLTDQAEHQSSRYSVGTIPNMPPETSQTYPATNRDMFQLGPWQDIADASGSWGQGVDKACQDYDLTRCPDASACPTNYACRGRVCLKDYTINCLSDADCGNQTGPCRGVCVDPSVQCIRHSDCANDQMCSGVGTCETPTLSVFNRLRLANDSINLKMSKSLDMRFHWIRDRIRQHQFRVLFVPGRRNIADFFTKALPVARHRTLAPFSAIDPDDDISNLYYTVHI